MSIFTLATALKFKNRDFQLHFKLAKLLEEKLFFENIYGSEKEVHKAFVEIYPFFTLRNFTTQIEFSLIRL